MSTEQIRAAVLSVEGTVFVDNSHTHNGPVYFDGITWQVMADSSVTGASDCFELVSPVMKGARGMKMAHKVIRAMERGGAQTHISAGIHVTFGMQNNSRWNRLGASKKGRIIKRLCEAYSYFKGNGIDCILAPSRRNGAAQGNRWAPDAYRQQNRSSWSDDTWTQQALNGTFLGKYEAVNLSKLVRSQAIEFRQHQSSFNATKVLQWVRLLDAFLSYSLNEEHAEKSVTDYNSRVSGMLECLDVSVGVHRYFTERARLLRRQWPTVGGV